MGGLDLIMKMETSMREIFEIFNSMAMAVITTKMDNDILENIRMGFDKEEVNIILLMGMSTKGNSNKMKSMEWGHTSTQMEINSREPSEMN